MQTHLKNKVKPYFNFKLLVSITFMLALSMLYSVSTKASDLLLHNSNRLASSFLMPSLSVRACYENKLRSLMNSKNNSPLSIYRALATCNVPYSIPKQDIINDLRFSVYACAAISKAVLGKNYPLYKIENNICPQQFYILRQYYASQYNKDKQNLDIVLQSLFR